MAKAIISRFDGGLAEDIRTTATNQCATAVNFDVHTNPHKLTPYSDPVAETHTSGPMIDYAITDVASLNVSAVPTIHGMGRTNSGATTLSIFKKSSTSDITSIWSAALATGGNVAPGTLIRYYDATANLDKLYFLNGGVFSSFDTPATITTHGAIATPYTTNLYPRPFVHPVDNAMYIGGANKVYKFDAVTYTSATLLHTLADYFEITSFADYGTYLAIGGRYFGRDRKSTVYLSNKDITSPQELPVSSIDWGEGSLVHIENIGGVLVGISYTEEVGSYTSVAKYKLFIKTYSGGTVRTIKEIETRRSDDVKIWTAKSGDKLYFGFDTDRALYVVGMNKLGEIFIVPDRYYNPTGSYITGTFNGVSFIGDISFVAYQDGGTTGYLVRQGTSSAYTLTSIYETTVNSGVVEDHRVLNKQIKKIRISYTVNTANGTVGVGLRLDSQTASYDSVISESKSSTGEYVTTATMKADGSAFDTCYELQLRLTSTGNVSIKRVEVEYDVIND